MAVNPGFAKQKGGVVVKLEGSPARIRLEVAVSRSLGKLSMLDGAEGWSCGKEHDLWGAATCRVFRHMYSGAGLLLTGYATLRCKVVICQEGHSLQSGSRRAHPYTVDAIVQVICSRTEIQRGKKIIGLGLPKINHLIGGSKRRPRNTKGKDQPMVRCSHWGKERRGRAYCDDLGGTQLYIACPDRIEGGSTSWPRRGGRDGSWEMGGIRAVRKTLSKERNIFGGGESYARRREEAVAEDGNNIGPPSPKDVRTHGKRT